MAHNVEKEIDGVIRTVTELDHTAQQIDDAVDDVAHLKRWHSNPNIFDNWYWADPDSIIDQRGGYVVPPGVDYYSRTDSTVAGKTTGYVKVDAISVDGYSNALITINGVSYYVKKGNYVRGYVGASYTIDRWIISGGGNMVLTKDGVNIKRKTKGVSDAAFYSRFEMARFLGKTCTLSALANGELYTVTGKIPDVVSNSTKLLFHSDITMPILVRVYETASGLLEFGIVNQGDGDCITKAAKLELGSVQTLAHQDADGKWVLNDPPPNRQQELAKCQRYQLFIRSVLDSGYVPICTGNAISTRQIIGYIPTPARLNKIPAAPMQKIGNFNVRGDNEIYRGVKALYVEMVSTNNLVTRCIINDNDIDLTPGNSYEIFGSPGSILMIDANL